MNILKVMKHFAIEHPNQIAFKNQVSVITYGELWEQSNQLASYILKKSSRVQSPMIVYGHMDPSMLVCFLGSVKAGHPYIPIDQSIPLDRVYKIIERSQAEFFFATEEIIDSQLETNPIEILQMNDIKKILKGNGSEPTEEQWVKEDETFYIIYTSGSTGNPKGVQISANNVGSFVNWMLADFPIKKQQIFLNQAPFSFDLSVMDVYPALCSGGTLVAITKDMVGNPNLLFDALRQSNIQIWTSTPSFAQVCLMDPSFKQEMLPHLETILFCGEILPVGIAKQLQERFPKARIFNLYGPTEATVAITKLEVTREIVETHPVLPIGTCKTDTELLIVDEQGYPVSEGEKGEFIIVGPSVSKGYLNEQELTEKSFIAMHGRRAYKTGDTGYMKDGMYYYLGRLDFQVKVHGYRMELEEIEYNIAQSVYVKACIVEPVYREEKVDFLTAYIVPNKHEFEKEYQLSSVLRKELLKLLPAYMIPRKFTYLDNLPMTANGKVDRKKLAAGVRA